MRTSKRKDILVSNTCMQDKNETRHFERNGKNEKNQISNKHTRSIYKWLLASNNGKHILLLVNEKRIQNTSNKYIYTNDKISRHIYF